MPGLLGKGLEGSAVLLALGAPCASLSAAVRAVRGGTRLPEFLWGGKAHGIPVAAIGEKGRPLGSAPAPPGR